MKRLWSIFLMTLVAGCISESTVRQRVSDALSTSSIGPTLFFKSEMGCVYGEIEFFGDRVIPKGLSERSGDIGEYWAKLNSISELLESGFPDVRYNFDFSSNALVAVRNCAPDSERFYRMVDETPGFVSSDNYGEAFIFIPLDETLPVVYFAGQV